MKTKIIALYIPYTNAKNVPEFMIKGRFKELMKKNLVESWDIVDLDHLGKEAANKITNSDWEYTKGDVIQPNGTNGLDLGMKFFEISAHINKYLMETYPIIEGVLDTIMKEERSIVLAITSNIEALTDIFASSYFLEEEIDVYTVCIGNEEYINEEMSVQFDYIISEQRSGKIVDGFTTYMDHLSKVWSFEKTNHITSGFIGVAAPPEVGEIRYDTMSYDINKTSFETYTPSENWMKITDWRTIEPPWCYGKIAID